MADGKATEEPGRGSTAPGDGRALVDDLFESGSNDPVAAQVPLDPSEFDAARPEPAEGPTQRIDLEAPGALNIDAAVTAPNPSPPSIPDASTLPDPSTLPDAPPTLPTASALDHRDAVAPPSPTSPAPLDLGWSTPAAPEAAPPGPPQELDLGFAVGSAPPAVAAPAAAPPPVAPRGPSDAGGIIGLPLGSQPAAASAPPRTPRLPCTVVVVAEDRRAGAQLAGGLMAVGYTCRAATAAEVPGVLAGGGVDVAVVERPDIPSQVEAAARALAGWAGPIVFIGGSAPPSARPGWAWRPRPIEPEALVEALEAAREEAVVAAAASEADLAGAPPSVGEAAPLARVVRTTSLAGRGHVELTDHLVRALMVGRDGRTCRGRVRSMAYDGQLLVDLPELPESGGVVTVELIVVDGRRTELSGKVTRSGEGQVLIEAEVPEAQATLLKQFIDEARDPSQPAIEQVRIRARTANEAQSAVGRVDDEALRRLFDEAASRLDDDGAQQAFIQACIKGERLQFAVQCYRELKADRPDDERVAKYLNQVGTILGFYAFRKEDPAEIEQGMPKALKWGLFAFIFAALALWVIVEVLAA